ncbi:ATP-binding protein [Clostridium sp. AN503]|uniref:ATP-binding protein n=1 Tax=Clostridium sp. AN503 TaxID=3160598 RepID=UPI00345B086C
MKLKDKKTVAAVLLLLLLINTGLIIIGISSWNNYKMTVIDRHKEQMLLTSETVARTMEIFLNRNASDLRLQCIAAEEAAANPALDTIRDQIFQKYIDEQENFVTGFLLDGSDETSVSPPDGFHVRREFGSIDMGGGIQLTQCQADDGQIYFLLGADLSTGGRVSQVIDAAWYFNKLISDIRLGTNGYIMVKNSSGIILMHPARSQWGINALHDRKEMYHSVDLDSLEDMLRDQYQGNTGVSEYISYWWTDENLPRVKKISAYTPANVGDDFLIISAVTDYDDIFVPIAEGYSHIIFLLLLMFLAVMCAAGIYVRMLLQRQKDTEEIAYLKELNGILEQTQKSEEIIAHQQRLQIMGIMTGGIAHEFNNLLTPIMGYADLLMAEFPEDSEYYDEANEIFEAAAKAKEIIHQLSSLSRKNMETAYKEISLKQLLGRSLKMVRSVCPANVHLQDETDFRQEWILGNETQLNQAILNICVNAIHAIDRNEGIITVRGAVVCREALVNSPHIPPLPDTWERYIRLDFMDTGCGMSPEILEQIFDPFFTTKGAGLGTGLGLSLVEQIILSHKGFLYAESEPGNGSVFHLFLPLLERRSENNAEDHVPQPLHKNILAADDNPKVLRLLERDFKKVNISVTGAVNIGETLAALESGPFDVLLIDHYMSGTRAVDFCMSLRMKYPEMVTLVMTDKIRKDLLEAKQKNLISGYVEKPVSVTSVLEALREINIF